ncbi:hypothetical protein sscle_07g061720 [Sclerotinia sclerotiorum 1980 UF-70]|uniref:Uncharacterized protein n=1 Tax=Sclerotinia sclerotiorum (strain ATCC 18683 / 1980 / Ss-1) TaxID=665079 RepID=A0A1D9Q9B6_SCLS1|nr:hypothetical protein sscle_07g061720 [Sclerotinia sclerotiorum 1980 UF-70]
MSTTQKILTTIITTTVTIITLTLTLPIPQILQIPLTPLTPAPSTAALALLPTTTLIRGATAPIRCYERITTLASAGDCKRDSRECSEGSLVLTMV